MYSLHDLEVTNISVKKILGCEIKSGIGEHSSFTITAFVDQEDFLQNTPDCQDIEIWLNGEDGKKRIFSGIVTGIQVSESGQVETVQIQGKSRSWLMDRKKRCRTFQDSKMSYQALVKEILADYGGSSLLYAGPDEAIGTLIVQYNETDWDFLQRVLSRIGLMLTPESREDGIKLYAGIPDFPKTELAYSILEMEKDMEAYYRLKANGRKVHAADFTQYLVSSQQLSGIFASTMAEGQRLCVYRYRYTFESQDMVGYYGLQGKKGLKREAVYPMHLIGVALSGKVVKVSGSNIQAAMEIDGGNAKKRASFWFPYSTLSASTDGSGWYCMPEKGDDVRIYFPSKQEGEAIALSAVSNYEAPKNGGEDRMQDPNSRYLKSKSGQELALAPDYMKLSCGKSKSAVTIQTDGKVIIQGESMVAAMAKEEIKIYAEENLNIHVKEGASIASIKGGQIILEEGKAGIYGTEVKYD